ncbi:MAG TPA: DNA repair protein RadC [Syntrophales bacterium]|nr:DNA repair protein RadC [Syntrophales bacterium]HOX94689.1 DNA repair protein RadC [Syntrophales bacterium]HPI55780.1 DNA repair protein RadC [Syntrophales bacterium]HPN23728.1 DNA repair protein RadC [Syntrophales bacterium]HQM27746.1 DNA repair protein RadC [Syntrophales bacterium]
MSERKRQQDRGHRQRLKKRYSQSGIDTLHDYEVLELLLFYVIPRKDTKVLAKNMLGRFGSLKKLMDADPKEIEALPGIGAQTALLIGLVRDLGALYLREKAMETPQISSTGALLDYCMASMGGLKDERFSVIYLNAQNRIIRTEVIQEGIVNQAVVYPRKILEKALKHRASAVILVHNHPSGHIRPSEADIRLTRTLQDTARVLDILIHDHIIVGENRYFSFREEGLL